MKGRSEGLQIEGTFGGEVKGRKKVKGVIPNYIVGQRK